MNQKNNNSGSHDKINEFIALYLNEIYNNNGNDAIPLISSESDKDVKSDEI